MVWSGNRLVLRTRVHLLLAAFVSRYCDPHKPDYWSACWEGTGHCRQCFSFRLSCLVFPVDHHRLRCISIDAGGCTYRAPVHVAFRTVLSISDLDKLGQHRRALARVSSTHLRKSKKYEIDKQN